MIRLEIDVAEPPSVVLGSSEISILSPLDYLERQLKPIRKVRRPMDGLVEWHFGVDGMFAIVGSRLETFTVNWRSFDLDGAVEDYEDTKSIRTTRGFSRNNSHDELLELHGTPMQTRLDLLYSLGRQNLVTEYELFDGEGDFVYFRARFRDELASGIQLARKSAF